MRIRLMVLTLAGGVLLCAAALAQQEVRPTPGLGSGMMTIRGTVDVETMPPVAAEQRGEWLVHVTNMPAVSAPGSEFVRNGARYRLFWAGGDTETIRVTSAGESGWVQVENPGGGKGRRWINLAAARAIEEVP